MNETKKSQPITVDDLQKLYSELRGSRSAAAIMDARAFFLERQFVDALAKLDEAYQTYRESRMRILRQDPEKAVDAKAKDRDRQVRRLQRKQDKAKELIETFEGYLAQLGRLADKERARTDAKQPSPAAAPDSDNTATPEDGGAAEQVVPVTVDDVDEAFRGQFRERIGDRQLDLVSSRFGFRPLLDVTDVRPDTVYLLRKSDRCLLVRTQQLGDDEEQMDCIDLCNEKNRTRLSRRQMVKLSTKRRLVALTRKD